MPDVTQSLRAPAAPRTQPSTVKGFVSTSRPAPTSYTDPIHVVIPDHSPDYSEPMQWAPIHGTAMPQQGAQVLVVYDHTMQPYAAWWDGAAAFSPNGPAGGVLAGSYPNPSLAAAKYFHYDGSTTSYALTTSFTNPNTGHFQASLHTGANPVRVRLNNAMVQGTAGDTLTVSMFIDGAEATTHRFQPTILITGTTFWQPFSFEDESVAVSAGLHVIELRFGKSNAANTMTLRSGEGFGVVGSTFIVEESRANTS